MVDSTKVPVEAQALIDKLALKPHPEGGYYRETYRAGEGTESGALPGRYGGKRCFGTAIYYMLTPDTFSTMHRLQSDEIFHFYLGDPVEMLHLHADGTTSVLVLGSDVGNGQLLQVVVQRGVWQGARLRAGGRFALLGCTVAPGFEFADYEEGSYGQLQTRCPEQLTLLKALTRS